MRLAEPYSLSKRGSTIETVLHFVGRSKAISIQPEVSLSSAIQYVSYLLSFARSGPMPSVLRLAKDGRANARLGVVIPTEGASFGAGARSFQVRPTSARRSTAF